jgi:outer membrane protein
MKKLLIFTAVALIAISANAQQGSLYVGLGNISFWDNGDGFTGTGIAVASQGDNSTTFYGLAPEIGYFLSDDLAIGTGIGIGGRSVKDDDNTYFSFEISPYVRYFIKRSDNFGFYLQGGFGFASTTNGKYRNANGDLKDNTTTLFEIGVVPGVSYALSDNFSLTASFGQLGYSSSKAASADDALNVFGLSLDASTLQFGLFYTF